MADISQDNIKDLIKQFAAEDCVYLIAYVKVRDGVQHMCINDNLSGAVAKDNSTVNPYLKMLLDIRTVYQEDGVL